MKKKGGWLVELVSCVVGCLAFEHIPGFVDLVIAVSIAAIIGWVVLKLFHGGSWHERRMKEPWNKMR